MTTDSAQQWTVDTLLDLFDVRQDGENRFIAEAGPAGERIGRSSRARRCSRR